MIKNYLLFLFRAVRISFQGSWKFYSWMSILTLISLIGLHAWARQLVEGFVTTGMTDQVSWGAYVANFTFLVGVAAAAPGASPVGTGIAGDRGGIGPPHRKSGFDPRHDDPG